jgi:hypothetical protein
MSSTAARRSFADENARLAESLPRWPIFDGFGLRSEDAQGVAAEILIAVCWFWCIFP